MKLIYKPTDKILFEVDVDTIADAVKALAPLQEIFDDLVCTKYGERSENVRFQIRTDDDENEYFELVCTEPNSKLLGCKKTFGVKKKPKGQLFPHKKDKEGNWFPDNGWRKWNPKTEKEE